MKAKLEDTVELTRQITRSYYAGDPKPWLSHLCAKSIWMGTGDRLIIGGDAIRSYFQNITPRLPCYLYTEEYLPCLSRPAVPRWSLSWTWVCPAGNGGNSPP